VKQYIELHGSKYSYFNDLAMVFLNHFHLLVRYDADTKLQANLEKTKAVHISDHIREWCHCKRLIKVKVSPAFLLEWFLKSLVSCVSKDVANSIVFYEEEAIMRDQQLELIYSLSDMIYDILHDASWSTIDLTKLKARPHADGIMGSAKNNPIDKLSNQMQQLSLQHTMAN
jgi:hypothetical protein